MVSPYFDSFWENILYRPREKLKYFFPCPWPLGDKRFNGRFEENRYDVQEGNFSGPSGGQEAGKLLKNYVHLEFGAS
jgi:hypothetical protein